MKDTKSEGQEEEHSFDLSVENELLMLKLQAEFGAECTTGNADIPPSVVNEFLKSVYEFEKKFREPRDLVTIYEKIGRPVFRPAAQLTDREVSSELKRLLKLMKQHHLQLDIHDQYPSRLIYTFITEEFFNHEMDDLNMPGYVHHFSYEEFHPNHEMDIRNIIGNFVKGWFARNFSKHYPDFAPVFILPDTREFSKEKLVRKLQHIFEAYIAFSLIHYNVSEVVFEWDGENEKGRGFASGTVFYSAATEDGEWTDIGGTFQFYLSNTHGCWNIFYFVFPGFCWNQ